MTNYWAIAIGINQYEHFQPLMYAQRDAIALRNYWVNEAGFVPNCCVLLTDASPAFDETATLPTRDNIQSYIVRICQRLQPDDVLWCFFSGYGVQFNGKDYLMPLDGDPTQVATTGIAIDALFAQLQTAATDRILVVLDINRSQSAQAGDRVGANTAELAQQYGIATILSCAPDQFSHETLAVRHGLFTAALLEGLRYQGCGTVEHLAQHLRERVPELSDHHWRPRQDPIAVFSALQQYQLIVPQRMGTSIGAIAGVQGGEIGLATALPPRPYAPPDLPYISNGVVPNSVGSYPAANHVASNGLPSTALIPVVNLPLPPQQPPPQPATHDEPSSDVSDASDREFWRRVLVWGGAFALALLLLVLLRNQSVLFRNDPAPRPTTSAQGGNGTSGNSTSSPDASLTGGTSPSPTSTGEISGTNGNGQDAQGGSAAAFLKLDNGSSSNQNSTNGSSQTNQNSQSDNSNSGNSPKPPVDPSPTASPQGGQTGPQSPGSGTNFNNVRAALQSKQFDRALNLLDQVPASQRDETYNQLRQQANQGVLAEARALLNEVRQSTRINQASEFNRAIIKARRISSGDPLYEQAQQDISRWSQVILDMAQGRASRGNYDSAIAAARLISPNQQSYAAAQQAIAQWQQAKRQVQANQSTLDQAKRSIRRYQASSYNQAIATVRTIQPNQPLYQEAQALKNEWAAAILDIANTRAAHGAWQDAVRTATLVPWDTSAYSRAQTAIAKWKRQH